MRISFTGPGCSGKSTLLKKCQEYYGDRFEYIPEVTRPALHKGMKINEDGDSKTQLYILEEHMRNDKLQNVIMDRCIIDGWVYTTWLHGEGKVSEVVQKTYDKLYRELVDNLDIVFYTKPVELEDDGERSTNVKFINEIEQFFDVTLATLHLHPDSDYNKPKIVVLEGDVDKRFDDIKLAIEQYEHSTVG
jgi:nicotinamide riboside kinase